MRDDQRKAYTALQRALREKVILKPTRCDGCGLLKESSKLAAHHLDYKRPLYVQWLCHLCHRRTHEGLLMFKRSEAFWKWCSDRGMTPEQGIKKKAINPRNNRVRKITWYKHWRQNEWPQIKKALHNG